MALRGNRYIPPVHTNTHIRTRRVCMCVCVYIVNICTHTHMHMYNIHICATDIPRTFSRPVSSFVTLPSLFSDFLSSASAIHFFPGQKCLPGGMAKAKNREESESFSRILNASNVIHGQLSSRAGKRYSLARKIFSCEKKSVFGDTY